MKTVAYLRVSPSPRQDVQGQRLAIPEYARKHNLQTDEFVEAAASARPSPKQRRLADLMSTLKPGDRLAVNDLPRLDRRHARRPDQGRHRLHRRRGQLPLASSGLRSKPSNISRCDWMTASTLSDAARSLKPHASCRRWRPAASAVAKTTPSASS